MYINENLCDKLYFKEKCGGKYVNKISKKNYYNNKHQKKFEELMNYDFVGFTESKLHLYRK